MCKIVIIGGGTSTATLLRGLKSDLNLDLTAIVPVTDAGGSSKVFVDAFMEVQQEINLGGGQVEIVPPGDLANVMIGMSNHPHELTTLFNYRFGNLGTVFKGHSLRNIIVGAAMELWGVDGLKHLAELFNIRGQVLPVAPQCIRLNAILEDGTILDHYSVEDPKHPGEIMLLEGEEAVDYLPYQYVINKKITGVKLQAIGQEIPAIAPQSKTAIEEADIILFSPSDLWTSTIPILLVQGMKEALRNSKAMRCYFIPLMTKRLNTEDFAIRDFVRVLDEYSFPGMVQSVVYNSTTISEEILSRYSEEGAAPVEIGDIADLKVQIIERDLLDSEAALPEKNETAAPRSIIRHDPKKILSTVRDLVQMQMGK